MNEVNIFPQGHRTPYKRTLSIFKAVVDNIVTIGSGVCRQYHNFLTCLSEIHGRESVDEAVNIAEGELLMSKTMGVSPWFFIK